MAEVAYPEIDGVKLAADLISPYPFHFETIATSRVSKTAGRTYFSQLAGQQRGFIRWLPFGTTPTNQKQRKALKKYLDDMYDPVYTDPYGTLPIVDMAKGGERFFPTPDSVSNVEVVSQTTDSDNKIVTTLNRAITGLEVEQYLNIEATINSKTFTLTVEVTSVSGRNVIFRPYHRLPTGAKVARANELIIEVDRDRDRPQVTLSGRENESGIVMFFRERVN